MVPGNASVGVSRGGGEAVLVDEHDEHPGDEGCL